MKASKSISHINLSTLIPQVVFCFSFCLFLWLGSSWRRSMTRWIREYYRGGQWRNNPSVVAAPIRLNPTRSQTSTMPVEHPPPLPPYPRDHLPPYYSINDAPANNTDANTNSRTNDHSSDTTLSPIEFSTALADTNSVTSVSTAIDNDNELSVLPTGTPFIPTIPLIPQ